ncbi:hypothetical protein AWJ20_1223 [Sugiyamaella lignohabitans]|uniref:NmrA-like domain-containing protein n=1 Tax=Sugiyamaella lignohabitans TaxID=796027 RepID=A0A167DI67_9ASCO|nr:uncharacterized protein AWJ20_1223 [Sugiyamaella lignohabitans]ANB12945.1 hypothetical protein AWJ20_1223 [Sugiyamaella lignohabitans]
MAKTVAVAGVNGLLGKHVLNALQEPAFKSSFNFPIRVLSRSSGSTSTSDIEYHQASDLASYEKALKGVDVLIDLRGAEALASNDLILAAKAAGVTAYVPSEFGDEYEKAGKYAVIFGLKANSVKVAKEQGLQVIKFRTSYFLDIAFGPLLFLDPKAATSDYVGDGSTNITVTSLRNIGQAVASVLTHPFDKIPENVNVAGSQTTPAEAVKLFEKYSGKKVTVNKSTVEGLIKVADDVIASGEVFKELLKFLYVLRVISVTSDAADFKTNNDNEFINPGEKYFKWDKVEDFAAKTFA